MKPLRIFDSDFATDNSSLVMLAHQVAGVYNGNWREMIEYKRMVSSGTPLDARQARSVLNMALSDSAQIEVWPAIRAALAGNREVALDSLPEPGPRLPADNAWVAKRKLHLVQAPKRNNIIDLPVKFKLDYGAPYQRNGSIHLIDQQASFCRWKAPWDRHLQDYDYEHRVPELWVAWQCGRFAHSKVLFFRSDREPIAVDRALCTKCFPAVQ